MSGEDFACCEPAQRGGQPELVERRRAKAIDQPTDVSDHRLHLVGGRDEERVGALEIRIGEIAHGLEREREPGKRGAKAIVQISTDAPSLLLAQLDQVLPRQPEFE